MTREEESRLLSLLGIFPPDFQRVQRAPSFEQAKQELELLKERARKGFRKVAIELHPDQNGGDEMKTETFKQLNGLVQKIEKLQLRPPQPRPVIMTGMPFVTGVSTSGATTTVNVIFSVMVNGVRVR
jgi:hypothetical protein